MPLHAGGVELPLSALGPCPAAMALKADLSHTHDAGDLVSGVVDTDRLGSGTPDASTYLRGDQSWATPAGGSEAFPVGAVFIAVVNTNPATLLGYGTWSAFAAGRVLVGLDAGQTEFDVVEETGGAKTHTLTTPEIPSHSHGEQRFPTTSGGSSGFTTDTSMSGTPTAVTQVTQAAGGGGAHNNLQPYIVVYMWKRTA